MTEEVAPYDVLGAGAGGPLPVPSPWIPGAGFLSYSGGVVIGSPTGGNEGPGTLNVQVIYVNGVQFGPNTTLSIAGGTLTGPLILSANPTTALGAATKQYVDTGIAGAGIGTFLPLAGGTLTGSLTLAADPTLAAQASTKNYVDGRTPITTDAPANGIYYMRYNNTWQPNPGGITIPDAPQDGTSYMRNNGAWTGTIDPGTF